MTVSTLFPTHYFFTIPGTDAAAAGYQVFFYLAGTSTKEDTFTESDGLTANANPIVLDVDGTPPNQINGTDGTGYKVVIAPPLDTDPPASGTTLADNYFTPIGGIFLDLANTDTDDGTKGFHLVYYPPLSTETGVTKYEYKWYDVRRYGAVADATTDCITAIRNAIISARNVVSGGAPSSIGIYFPDGEYYISIGIPWPRRVNLITESRWGTKITCDSNSYAVLYTATESGGVFTDNLDAGVSLGAQEADQNIIKGIHFNHTGTLTGNSPDSATAWKAAGLDINGAPDSLLEDIRVSATTDSYGGINLVNCWRMKVVRYYTSRGGSNEGGVALELDSQCNLVDIVNPTIFGPWDIGIRVTNPYSVTISRPDVENVRNTGGTAIGILVGGWLTEVTGAYMEGNDIDFAFGVSGGTQASHFNIVHPYLNPGSVGDVGFDLVGVNGGNIMLPFFGDTFLTAQFRSGSTTNNGGARITLQKSDAADSAALDLSTIGLGDGNNIVAVYGRDKSDHGAYKEYSTATGNLIEQEINQRNGAFQAFSIKIVNTSGTMQHSIFAGATATTAIYDDKVTGATTTLTNTPLAAAGVDFAAGGGIVAAATNKFVINTATQEPAGEFSGVAHIANNTSGTALTVEIQNGSRDINGTTRFRPEFTLRNAATGAVWNINTTNFTAGQLCYINILMFIK